jgi:hypothetical protein
MGSSGVLEDRMSKEIEERLRDYSKLLRVESLELIDFDALISDLETARETLGELRDHSSVVERITSDVKGEVRRMLLAIARVKGETASTSMVAGLLDSPDLGYEELRLLKKEVVSEFNRCLPNRPLSQYESPAETDYLSVSEYK